MSPTGPSLGHLFRMSDDTGLLEHARGAVPRREHGYCVDDVARGLIVLCRQPGPTPGVVELAGRFLAFLDHAQAPDGRSHNRLGYDRTWQDEPGLGDWWGRALWAYGTAAARPPAAWMAAPALHAFELGAAQRSPWPRAMAFAALGAAEVVRARPGHSPALSLLADAALVLGGSSSGDPAWPWPEPRLGYANAAWPEALVAAGHALGERRALDRGLALLEWLLSVETAGDRLSPTPCGGWGPGEPRPGFDQQPIEAAALADASARAHAVTGDPRWLRGVELSVAWFMGHNDAGTSLLDPATGGGYDGLEAGGRNRNQGAESTLALISTLQLAPLARSGRVPVDSGSR